MAVFDFAIRSDDKVPATAERKPLCSSHT